MHLAGSIVIFLRSEGLKGCSLELLLSFKRQTMFPLFSVSRVLQIWLCKDQQTRQSNEFSCFVLRKTYNKRIFQSWCFTGHVIWYFSWFYEIWVKFWTLLNLTYVLHINAAWKKGCIFWHEKISCWMVSWVTGGKRKLLLVPKLHSFWRSICHSCCVVVMNWALPKSVGLFNWCAYSVPLSCSDSHLGC